MIDNHFRALLPRYVNPLVDAIARIGFTPNQITVIGLVIALISAALVANGNFILAILIWWLSRLCDALDGILARRTNRTSDFGAFLDIQLDMLAYSAMILGLYWHLPEYSLQWMIILLCYVLCISGALGLGSFEAKVGVEDSSGRGLRLASGLAEGGETGIAYSVFLLFPQTIEFTSWAWITILSLTIVSRIALAKSELGHKP